MGESKKNDNIHKKKQKWKRKEGSNKNEKNPEQKREINEGVE